MPIPADLLTRRQTQFVLWNPKPAAPAPTLVIGQFKPANPNAFANMVRFAMPPIAGLSGLFAIDAASCGLGDGEVYHYWFDVGGVLCTDPAATAVDWRLRAPLMPAPSTPDDRQPAAVVKFTGGILAPSDPMGEQADFTGDPSPATLAPNNSLVIYELPTAWSRMSEPDDLDIGVGTFADVLSLIDANASGANFDDVAVTQPGQQYLVDLGINALELLPPADSFFKREWGYDTSHYLAPDADLGFPEEHAASTANRDLAKLVCTAHRKGIRFFIDAVMAFARHEAYQYIDIDDFYIADPAADPDDPDSHTSRGTGPDNLRNGFGSVLFRYARFIDTYDPIGGAVASISPGRQLMLTYLTRWMRDFRVDGVRMDSVENVSNWDFVQAFKDRARQLFAERCAAQRVSQADADARFLVVGEELSIPLALLTQGRLDGLWNDTFRGLVRAMVIGQGDDGAFQSNVRQAIDCRNLGFADGTQAVNYITSHDVEGPWRQRLFNFLGTVGLQHDFERRVKLAFVCLLTAVGVPMILAGEEFADQHERFDQNGQVDQAGGKQVDPVNYTRLEGTDDLADARRRILSYVSLLVNLRTRHPALAVNDTHFLHSDFTPGRRVMAWQRGNSGTDPVVVLANFSDFATDTSNPDAEYVVPNFPATPAGRQWREVTQERPVPLNWIGREPIFGWEAKVYTLA